MHTFFLLNLAMASPIAGVQLVDPQGAPFRCATLTTVHHVPFETDDEGWAAIDEPGLLGGPLWLVPTGPGVVTPYDGLGLAGLQVTPTAGQVETIVLDRSAPSPPCGRGNAAERAFLHGRPTPAEHHTIQIVDADTGRPVPIVRLTLAGRERWTDNGGRVAWHDLDTMGRTRRVDIWADGYAPVRETVDLVPGTSTIVQLTRHDVAEHLVRLTGAGKWRDSWLVGAPTPSDALLAGRVLGQDTALAVTWRGARYWIWGDTLRPEYPLGSFHAAAARARPDADPNDGMVYDYLVGPTGFARPVAPMYAAGPVWLSGLVALDDQELWATFLNVAPDFTPLREGVVRWDDATRSFVEQFAWSSTDHARPEGPAIRYDGPYGPWVVYRSGHAVPADPTSMGTPSAYRSWTPLRPTPGGFDIERDASGVAVWQWRRDAPAPTRDDVSNGTFPASESPWHAAIDPRTGDAPVVHNGSIAWHPGRGRWLHVFTESLGTSLLGEVWFAEGDTPMGPWTWARKVLSHDAYSLYNPIWHPWDAQGDRVYFEGTYTAWLGSRSPTPRHDYNQVLYALELDDNRLRLPVPFYDGPNGPTTAHGMTTDGPVAFGALDRSLPGARAIRWTAPSCAPRTLSTSGAGEVAFWAPPPGTTGHDRVDLREWTLPNGDTRWSVEDLSQIASAGPALASVWRPRWHANVPLADFPAPDRADAGPDQCDVVSPVTVDGSGSRLQGGITDWNWSWQGGTARGVTAQLPLPSGLHEVRLTVEGPEASAQDILVIDVR